MTEVEAVAAALGLANILLIVRRSLWNYPVGITMVSLYGVVFWDAKLYSDALLQVFFLALNVYGWVLWRQARKDDEVPVRWMTMRGSAMMAAATIAVWLAWSAAMSRYTDAAAPYWDGAVAALSVSAQILMARRYVENWVYWIIVNLLAVGLFWSRDLAITAALYAVFLLMAVAGYDRWRKASRVHPWHVPVHP